MQISRPMKRYLAAGFVVASLGILAARELIYKVPEMPPVVYLHRGFLKELNGIVPMKYTQGRYVPDLDADHRTTPHIESGIATDVDNDGNHDLVVAASDGDSSMLHIQTARGLKHSAMYNSVYSGESRCFQGLEVFDNNSNGLYEISITVGNPPVAYIWEYDPGNDEISFIGKVPSPKITGQGIFSVEKEGGSPALRPYIFQAGTYVAGDQVIVYPREVQSAEERIVQVSREFDYSDPRLAREINRITAELPEEHRFMMGLQHFSLPGQAAITFADRFAHRLYESLGYDTRISTDREGNPFVLESGRKRAPRIAPAFTFAYGDHRVWRDPSGHFYTVDREGRLMDSFRIGRDGEIVYQGPVRTDFSSGRTIREDEQTTRVRDGHLVVDGYRTGRTSHPGRSSQDQRASRSWPERQRVRENLATGRERARQDLRRGIGRGIEAGRDAAGHATRQVHTAVDKIFRQLQRPQRR